MRNVLRQLLPGQVANTAMKDVIPWLYQDVNLGAQMLGLAELPAPVEEGMSRPPLGSLACFLDPDCTMFDMFINVQRPFLGLTEGQMRYLVEYTEENGRTNAEDLYGVPLVNGFTFVMPIAPGNPIGDLTVPSSRTGDNAGPDFYLAIRTSNAIQNLDSFVPFIRPQDITVGTNLRQFTQGDNTNVERIPSVSSIGWGRPGTSSTSAMIGRPEPLFQFNDLTQPGLQGENLNNNNFIFDRAMGSPPKAVIGIDVQDFGANPTEPSMMPVLIRSCIRNSSRKAVLGELEVEFLPGTSNIAFSPAFQRDSTEVESTPAVCSVPLHSVAIL